MSEADRHSGGFQPGKVRILITIVIATALAAAAATFAQLLFLDEVSPGVTGGVTGGVVGGIVASLTRRR